MDQLGELFDTYAATSSPQPDVEPHQRTAPISALPALIDAFESRRGIQLLTEDEKVQLAYFASSAGEARVGVDDFIGIIQAMGSATSQAASASKGPVDNLDAPSSMGTSAMLAPEPSNTPADGSPAPRRRSGSAMSTSSLTSSTTPPASPSKLSKRRSLLSALSSSSKSAAGAGSDLSGIVVSRGGTYLGVPLDGPLGAGFNAEGEADKLRVATKGMGVRCASSRDGSADC